MRWDAYVLTGYFFHLSHDATRIPSIVIEEHLSKATVMYQLLVSKFFHGLLINMPFEVNDIQQKVQCCSHQHQYHSTLQTQAELQV